MARSRKPRNVHFILSYENPREAAINRLIDLRAEGMTLKEYICSLIENGTVLERLERIEQLLQQQEPALHAGAENTTSIQRPDEEQEDNALEVDDDVMDFLAGLE